MVSACVRWLRVQACAVLSNAHIRMWAVWRSNLLFCCGCAAIGDVLALRPSSEATTRGGRRNGEEWWVLE